MSGPVFTRQPPEAMQDVATQTATSRLFNAAVAAAALSAASELGVLAALERDGVLDVDAYSRVHALHAPTVRSLLFSLASFGLVTLDEASRTARPGPGFGEVVRDQGYFLWLIRGYGSTLRDLASLARVENRPADPDDHEFVGRDGPFIALAGRDYGARHVDPPFRAVLDAEPYRVVADLGCGSAARLISLVQRSPEVRGIGVELDAGAVEVARRAVRDAGVEDRVAVIRGDVRRLEYHSELAEADVAISFFVGHDLWPRPRCLAALEGVARALPRAGRFLLCDTFRSAAPPSPDLPTFTLGFEVTHAVMGQEIPTRAEWEELFQEGPWRCVATHPVGIPYTAIFDLRRAGAEGSPA